MENYKENISKLKSEREDYKKRISEITENIDSILSSFFMDFKKNSISWDQLKVYTIGKFYTINDAVQLIKTYENDQEIRFEAHIKKINHFGSDSYHVEEMVLTNELST